MEEERRGMTDHGSLPLPDLVDLVEPILHHVPRRIRPQNVRHACVAIILRICPSLYADTWKDEGPRVPPPSDPDQLLAWLEPWLDSNSTRALEILFVKRAVNPKDRWSGQVALPGGRQDEGESDFDTVTREVREEVGLDLSSGFVCLGRLDDHNVFHVGTYPPLVLSPFVFLQFVRVTPPLCLQQSEIAHARWASLLLLPLSRAPPVTFPTHRVFPLLGSLPGFLRLHTGNWPAFKLPPPFCHSRKGDVDNEETWTLWGLTLSVTNGFTLVTGLKPLTHESFTFQGNPIANAILFIVTRVMALVWQ